MRSTNDQAIPSMRSTRCSRLCFSIALLAFPDPVASRSARCRRSTCSVDAPVPVLGDSYLQARTKSSKATLSEDDSGDKASGSTWTRSSHRPPEITGKLKADSTETVNQEKDVGGGAALKTSNKELSTPSMSSPMSFFQVESVSNKTERQSAPPQGTSEAIAKLLNETFTTSSDEELLVLPLWQAEMARKAYLLCAILILFCAALLLVGMRRVISWARQSHVSPIRQRVDQIRLTSGAELESIYGLKVSSPSDVKRPLSPGLLICLQGRVRLTDHVLVSPLSSRKCAMYSASVSPPRYNGVQRPPLAFHSSYVDFQIELLDAPHICVKVQASDVLLFDMVDGRYSSESALAEAPDSWRSFIISYHTPNSCGLIDAKHGTSPSVEGPLEFCECALVADSMVTIVGEITREGGSELRLHPWIPPPKLGTKSHSGKPTVQTKSWLQALYYLAFAPKGLASDPAAGNVLMSDDPSLLPSAVNSAVSDLGF